MSRFDHSDLDGRLLRLLLAVVEEGSITRAAQRLDVTQSAVSHLLDKLRAIVGDPIVVRSGRGVVPTARAQELARRARTLLEDLRDFAAAGSFDPARLQATVTVAANDLQCDLLLPALLRRLRAEAPGLSLRVIPSGVPSPELLRDDRAQLLVTPRPPEAADVVHKRLFEDRYAVFYDPACRAAPAGLADYLAADHVTVVYEPYRTLEVDRLLAEQGLRRRFAAMVPGFAGVGPFLRGTPWLATLPAVLQGNLLAGFATAPPPAPCPPMPMFMAWHLRRHDDPMHRWLRQALQALLPAVLPPALHPPPALP